MPDLTLPHLFAAWRELIVQLERTANRAANSAMSTDRGRQAINRALLGAVVAQELGHRAMQRMLELLDLPTREDIAALGERLHAIERQLTQLCALLEFSHPEAAAVIHRPLPSPPRTRKPPPAAAADTVAGKAAGHGAGRKKVADKVATRPTAGRVGPASRRRSTSPGTRS